MSKVYIEGFKIPKCCKDCKMYDFYSKDCVLTGKYVNETYAYFCNEKGFSTKIARYHTCPLREIKDDTTK